MTRSPLPDAPVARTASLLAVPARAAILLALADGRARPATELARAARISAATASEHLARLTRAGLLLVEREGRHRYFRLRDPEHVTGLLEALAALAPAPRGPAPHDEAFASSPLRRARTCYRHLAGVLGVAITDALVGKGWLALDGRFYELSEAGARELESLGVDVEGARRARRTFARACLDWSERRYHLAGALGGALCDRMFEAGWVERNGDSRITRVTPSGRRVLRQRLGVDVW
jgi:DNA-binding transcriptional ArsR family regulator